MKKPKAKPDATLKFLKNLKTEDQMHDDHGPVIIGRRDRKPKIPEDKENKQK
jgi:hypothetical protein